MWWLIAALGVLALGAALWGPIVSNVEQPNYTVVEKDGAIEIRDYEPMVVAEARVTGERREAINEGFRIIADYIFGDNSAAKTVAMTAPVTQQSGQKIAMTAPVTQQGESGAWKVRFVMPSSYSLATLPRPNNPAVLLEEVPASRFAVIRFSGRGTEQSLERHASELAAYLKARNLAPLSAPVYAFYNPPWTLPFLRRNEVMVEIARPQD